MCLFFQKSIYLSIYHAGSRHGLLSPLLLRRAAVPRSQQAVGGHRTNPKVAMAPPIGSDLRSCLSTSTGLFNERVPGDWGTQRARLRVDAAADLVLAGGHPNATALRTRDSDLTFGELSAYANRFANALAAKGIGKGDRIVFLLDCDSVEFRCSSLDVSRG